MNEPETKLCTSCGQELSLDFFCMNKSQPDGKHYSCKLCKKEYNERNKEKTREYYLRVKEDKSRKVKEYQLKNKDKIKKRNADWYKKNRERIIEKQKEYRKNNKDLCNSRERERLKSDPQFLLTKRVRTRVRDALIGRKKSAPTEELIGCTFSFLKAYIEDKFIDGMTWDNRHLWHIDHIRPCSSFDLTDPEQQKKCFHYTNMQPLWAEDNIRKGDKYDGPRG